MIVESSVLLCDFHRLQAWNRFLKKGENDIPPNVALQLKKTYLKPLLESRTEKQYQERRKNLMESDEWKKYPKFAQYMRQTWLPEETCRVGLSVTLTTFYFQGFFSRFTFINLPETRKFIGFMFSLISKSQNALIVVYIIEIF